MAPNVTLHTHSMWWSLAETVCPKNFSEFLNSSLSFFKNSISICYFDKIWNLTNNKENAICFFFSCKVEKSLKVSLDSIPLPSPLVKIQVKVMGGKVYLRCRSKFLLGIVNKLDLFKNLLQYFAFTSSKFSRQIFEFSLKVMRSHPGYLLKSFHL